MKKWIISNGYAALMSKPANNALKLCDLSPRALVETTGELDGLFERVIYSGAKNYVGWILVSKSEPYIEGLPVQCVDIKDIQTPDSNDAEQYVLWKKYKQVNLCGELCVAYLLNVKLSDLLGKWEVKQPAFYKRVFGNGMARGTGDVELVDMFKLFDVSADSLSKYLPVYTPNALMSTMNNSGVIVGCNIDSVTGRLRGSGVGHWVVVTEVVPERTGYGIVKIYNPFPNRIEFYSWQEFLASARSPFGARITGRSIIEV